MHNPPEQKKDKDASLSADKIRTQLNRILDHSSFADSRRSCDFLRFVVEETLNGKEKFIKGYTIALEVFNRDESFDPQMSSIVRMQAARLRRSLEHYYLTEGKNDLIRIEIPKGSYIPKFIKIADSPIDETPEFPNSHTKINHSATNTSKQFAVAVLHFDNISEDKREDHFATGLTEEIIIALTQFSDLKVIGPLSREKLLEEGLEPRRIGQKYKVRFLLDGNVLWVLSKLRVRAKLIDTKTGAHCWGESYTRNIETESLFDLEDDITGKVVGTIADNFGIIPRTLAKECACRKTNKIEAQEATFLFHHANYLLTPDSLTRALEALERAIKLDPNYALAAAMLADLHCTAYLFGMDQVTPTLEKAEKLARQAIVLDPNCQHAHFSMALCSFCTLKLESFNTEIDNAIALNPNNANIIWASALFLFMLGQREQAINLMQKAMSLNSHHPGWYSFLPYMINYFQGNYEAALIEAQRYNVSNLFWDPLLRAAVLGQLNHRVEANSELQALLSLCPDFKDRGKELIRRHVIKDEYIEMLLEGLYKAGLEKLKND